MRFFWWSKSKKTTPATEARTHVAPLRPPYPGCQDLTDAVHVIPVASWDNPPIQAMYSEWRWLPLKASDLPRPLIKTSPEDRRKLYLASLNHNGFVREVALKKLALTLHSEHVPFVLHACKDWVPQVRNAAHETLKRLLKPEYAEAFLRHYRVVSSMQRIQRTDLIPIEKSIHDLLKQPACRTPLQQATKSLDAQLRRFSFLLLADDLPYDEQLQSQIAADPESSIKRWFLRQLDRLTPNDRNRWLQTLMQSSSAGVARSAIHMLNDETWHLFRDTLLQQASHPHRSTRLAARYALRDWSNTQFADHYRELLRSSDADQTLPGILEGLGETGDLSDVEFLKPHINASSTRTRFAALRGMTLLDRQNASDLLITAFDDRNGRIRKLVAETLIAKTNEQEHQALYDALKSTAPATAALTALKVFGHAGSWRVAPSLLLGASHPSEAVNQQAWERGTRWIQKYAHAGWLKPDAQTRPLLRTAWDTYQSAGRKPPHPYDKSWQNLETWIAQVLQET